MKYLWTIVLIFALAPIFASASTYQPCKNYAFLKSGFNINDAQRCTYHLKSCPKTGPVLDNNCVKEIVKRDPTCRQLKKLSSAINADIASLSFEKIDGFILIDQAFTADGQHNFYVISPTNCLLNTKIDPRILSPALIKQHKNTLFMIVNWDKPKFQTDENGNTNVLVLLKVTKNCLACELLGWAKVRYDFNKNGKLIKTTLLSFSKTQ